jgi:putative phosphoesterase
MLSRLRGIGPGAARVSWSVPGYDDAVAGPRTREASARVAVGVDGSLRLGVVADTHSAPHPETTDRLRSLCPDAILHAGDIGDLVVLDDLARIAPVFAVRGNIDVRAPSLPDVLTLDVVAGDAVLLRILMMHIAVDGPRLRADAGRLARARDASLVVCGHSHVPLVAREGDVAVFNPGSVGPRRFHLPIVFGTIDISTTAVRLEHFDVATGERWTPDPSSHPARMPDAGAH